MSNKNPNDRNNKAKEKIKEKKAKTIVIYGPPINQTTGLSKVIYFMAKALQSAGHKVNTIGSTYNDIQTSYDGIPIFPSFNCERCGRQNAGDYIGVEKMINYINAFNPDVFLIVGDPYQFQQYGFGNISLEKINNIKAMAYITYDSEGIFCNEQLSKKKGRRDYLQICDKIISMAGHTQKILKEYEELDSEVVYAPVDTLAYAPINEEEKLKLRKKHNIPEKAFVAYYSGRNTMRKKTFILLDALCEMCSKNDDFYGFLNYASIDKDYPDHLNPLDFISRVMKKKYNKDFLSEGRIIFVERGVLGDGNIGETENSEYYRLSDLYVTTTGGEGLGLTALESMSCGVPALVPDNSTGKEVLGDKVPFDDYDKSTTVYPFTIREGGILMDAPIEQWIEYGLKQNYTTPEITYEAIKYMYDHPELIKKLAVTGRKRVLKVFDLLTYREKWLNIINTTKKKEKDFKEVDFDTEMIDQIANQTDVANVQAQSLPNIKNDKENN